MTLDQYDTEEKSIRRLEANINRMQVRKANLESWLHREAGIAYVDREPGFPCWHIDGLSGYFNTPREAVEALEKLNRGK